MNKRYSWLLTFLVLAAATFVNAQQSTKIPRIGFLSALSSSSMSARTEAFQQGLRDLGYVEGRNIVIEWRYAEEKADRLRELATS